MKRKNWILFLLLASLSMAFLPGKPGQRNLEPWQGVSMYQTPSPLILVMKAEGPVSAGMREYMQRSIEIAGGSNPTGEVAAALIIQLNTLGGSVQITYQIIEMIRASKVPVIVYVSPSGAIAASAGTLITMAGHAAVMAPQTSIGAASPVLAGGENLDDISALKTKEALKATVRSLMVDRRPEKAIQLVEETIDKAVAYDHATALSQGIIDAVAVDLGDLGRQLDGMVVQLQDEPHTLRTANAIFKNVEPSPIEQFFQLLTNPNLVFALLNIGLLALLVEITTPGGWVAGFFGVIAVTMAAFGLGALGVNWVGLIFLVAAFVLFVLEFKTPTNGALTIAGVASFITGGLVLFNSPGAQAYARVSVPLVVGGGLAMGAVFFTVLTFALRSLRSAVKTGVETLVGQRGRVVVELAPRGIVQLAGEQWSAEVEDRSVTLPPHTLVEVVRVQGLHLYVKQVD